MDFKYIEQLLERYFAAETTLQEEQVLRAFFAQDEVPEYLRIWAPLFAGSKQLSGAHLTDSFDERILQLAGEVHVKARKIPLKVRLRPLFKAAALVAFSIVIGTTMEHTSKNEVGDGVRQSVVFSGEDELDANETSVTGQRSASAEPVDTLPRSH